jgi:GNAT superfamily N-acetyltransferase
MPNLGESPNYDVVRYEPRFKSFIPELQTNLWSPSVALNAVYFDWKYQRNPYVKEPLIYLALCDGKPVGMRGFFGTRWEGGTPSRRMTVLYADDTVVVPEHRRKGIMSKIMSAAFRDLSKGNYSYALNLSAGSVVFQSSLSTGWRSPGWVRPIRRRSWPATFQRVRSIVEEKWPSMPRPVHSAMAVARRSLRSLGPSRIPRFLRSNPDICLEDAPRCAEMADLVARIGTSGRIRHVRDGEYFSWRFQNPLSSYRFLYWIRDRLEGYLVLQEYRSDFADHDRLNIVDWEGSSPAVQWDLLRAACVVAHDRPLWIWAATLPEAAAGLLKGRDFRIVGEPPTLPAPPAILVHPLRNDQPEGDWQFADRSLLDLANWDLRMLYSMHG